MLALVLVLGRGDLGRAAWACGRGWTRARGIGRGGCRRVSFVVIWRYEQSTRSQTQPMVAVPMYQLGGIEAKPGEVRERDRVRGSRDARYQIAGPLRYVPRV